MTDTENEAIQVRFNQNMDDKGMCLNEVAETVSKHQSVGSGHIVSNAVIV
jgi:hypothetical protein